MSAPTAAAPDAREAEPATPAELVEAQEKFSLARAQILRLWPYLHAAAFRLVPRWTHLVPTMAVDGKWRLYMNARYVLGLSPNKLALLVACHELKHALYGHSTRLADYRHMDVVINGQTYSLANIACDLAINSQLAEDIASAKAYRAEEARKVNNSLATVDLDLPPEAMYPSRFVDQAGKPFPDGLLAEQYAQLLIANASQVLRKGKGKGKGKGAGKGEGEGEGEGDSDPDGKGCCGRCGSGGGDVPQPWEDPSDAAGSDPASGVTAGEQEVLKRQTARAAQDQSTRCRGTVPGYMERWAQVTLRPPKVDWRRELRALVREGVNWLRGQHSRSFARRNRRQVVRPVAAGDPVLPGRVRPEPDLVIVLDTCLRGDSPVTMWDGSVRRVDEVAVGDTVRGHDRSGRPVPAEVRRTFRYDDRLLVRVVLDDGREIYCTGRHRFLSKDLVWVRAENLTANTELLTLGAPCARVTSDASLQAVDGAGHPDPTGSVPDEDDSRDREDRRSQSGVNEATGVETRLAGSPARGLVVGRRPVHARELQAAGSSEDGRGARPDGGRDSLTSLQAAADRDSGRRLGRAQCGDEHADAGRDRLPRGDHRRGRDDNDLTTYPFVVVLAKTDPEAGRHSLEYEHRADSVVRTAPALHEGASDTFGRVSGLQDEGLLPGLDLRLLGGPPAGRDRTAPGHQETAVRAGEGIHRDPRLTECGRREVRDTATAAGAGNLLGGAWAELKPVHVRSVDHAGTAEVFDLATTTENYVVNGVICHNSGSMGHGDFTSAFSEMREVVACAGGLVPVIPCDAAASEVQWVRRIEEVKMVGGGGTDMRVGIQHAYDVTGARLILVLSDGYTPWPDAPPAEGVRVIACLTQKGGTPPPEWIRSVYAVTEEDD